MRLIICVCIYLQEIDPEKQDISGGGDFEDTKVNHSEVCNKIFA